MAVSCVEEVVLRVSGQFPVTKDTAAVTALSAFGSGTGMATARYATLLGMGQESTGNSDESAAMPVATRG